MWCVQPKPFKAGFKTGRYDETGLQPAIKVRSHLVERVKSSLQLSVSGGVQQNIATPQTARERTRPLCRRFKNQSCCGLGWFRPRQGLSHVRGMHTQAGVKTGFKEATTKDAITKHKEWVRKFDDLRVGQKEEELKEACEQAEARDRFTAFNANLRKCILHGTQPVMHPAVRHQVGARPPQPCRNELIPAVFAAGAPLTCRLAEPRFAPGGGAGALGGDGPHRSRQRVRQRRVRTLPSPTGGVGGCMRSTYTHAPPRPSPQAASQARRGGGGIAPLLYERIAPPRRIP